MKTEQEIREKLEEFLKYHKKFDESRFFNPDKSGRVQELFYKQLGGIEALQWILKDED